MEFLQFQLEEFNKAELVDGEQERLEQEIAVLSNAEEIKRTMNAAFQYLSENEQSLVSQMEELSIRLHQVSKFEQRMQRLSERYDGLVEELKDISGEFEEIVLLEQRNRGRRHGHTCGKDRDRE